MIKLKNQRSENLDAKRASFERVFIHELKKSSSYFQDNFRNYPENLGASRVNILKR